jgi:hypothetical protein
MPAYNFQPQFVPMILDGSKHHTVRRRRKRPTKPGETLKLYTGMRTKNCKLIMEVTCTSVVPVKIYPDLVYIFLDGRVLSLQEVVHFSVRDGFTNPLEFFDFFKRYPISVRENELEVIYWR